MVLSFNKVIAVQFHEKHVFILMVKGASVPENVVITIFSFLSKWKTVFNGNVKLPTITKVVFS